MDTFKIAAATDMKLSWVGLLLSIVFVDASEQRSTCILALDTAVCNQQSIVKVPQNLPETIQTLNINKNSIKSISREDLLGYRQLRKLLASGNQLRTVDENAFSALRDLIHIDLSYNYITNISKNTFKYNGKLFSVNLRGNYLTLDPYFPLLISSSVESLDLSACGIYSISNVTFNRMEKLRQLFLGDNNIKHLDPNSFHKQRLKSLYIDFKKGISDTIINLCQLNIKVYYSYEINACDQYTLITIFDVIGTENKTVDGTSPKDNQNTIPEEINNETTNKTIPTIFASITYLLLCLVIVANLLLMLYIHYIHKRMKANGRGRTIIDPENSHYCPVCENS